MSKTVLLFGNILDETLCVLHTMLLCSVYVYRFIIPRAALQRAAAAEALDAVRGALPAAALSNVGIYGSGQAFEGLLLRMRSSSLPEARLYADLMLTELRKVIPSFLRRVDQPDRGGRRSGWWCCWRRWPVWRRCSSSMMLSRVSWS